MRAIASLAIWMANSLVGERIKAPTLPFAYVASAFLPSIDVPVGFSSFQSAAKDSSARNRPSRAGNKKASVFPVPVLARTRMSCACWISPGTSPSWGARGVAEGEQESRGRRERTASWTEVICSYLKGRSVTAL